MPSERLKSIKRVLILGKRTKFELDLEEWGSLEQIRKIYKIQNDSFARIHESHLRQISNRETLKRLFPNGTFIFRKSMDEHPPADFDLVISLGGDNHFTYVAHHAVDTLVLGCNSDPPTSVGALLSFRVEDLKNALETDWANARIEEWPLISVKIDYPDGRMVNTLQGISEISIRNNSPDLTSRFLICHGDEMEEQKCSGLLVYTGAGSTGWVMSCENTDTSFDKQSPFFKVYCRELRKKEHTRYTLDHFTVTDRFSLISEMKGGISIDSLAETIYDFPPGAKAEFSLSEKKLHVVVRNV
ncbi:NAD+ kinase [Leptospira gomenensis]|uniref:NAD+ kinase n=1 Tax=Leptospira gomenensis TaxID=2484974 RepID=A0A5F1YJ88_9LEPT|nr:NAD(+)/NADH kinase [Leptospira gomenensis]TGK38506.1 NAD+ kinase [Leptospira gomenensis]TGK42003.1 NAD+ kinase [Leptospira gomenensis]TGK52264.1 NAD+ kinase [Leptospira gomenensis]TGK55799.1 NAD+ kinase [Leptospira gomenensis]